VLGAEITARSGLTFLARVPEGFQPAERVGPPGAFAVVSDGERFVVLRATPALRAVQGQSVAVARDAKGNAPGSTARSAARWCVCSASAA
jgi:hypothetical protein